MAGIEERPAAWIGALGRMAAPSLSIVLLLLGWELLSHSGAVTPFMLPTIEAVIGRIMRDAGSGELAINLGLTLYRSLTGFLIAAGAGIALGMFISRSAVVRWFFDPVISVGFPMPKIAFLPIIVLWLGFYDVSKISMIVLDAIFPVVTATIAGIQGVEREILWSARNLGASEGRLQWEIALPAALPQILTGLQVALPIALIVDIVAEMIMGGYGIGGAMATASRLADSRGVFAGLVEIAVVGFCLVRAMALLRRRLLPWHAEAL
jgi:ABC-type nitrate/sulfonate/bicarbonate transport system permease component